MEVITFDDPKKGLQHLLTSGADIVFLDYRMPGLTGLEIADRLPAEIPKYLITGEVHLPEHPAIHGVFQKPYDPSAIQEIFDKFLRARNSKAS